MQDTGRDAICELRHTLRILRTDDGPPPPPPGGGPELSAAATPTWWTISWPWWADILLAAGLVCAVDGPRLWNGSRWLIAVAVVAGVAIALRRRHPLSALALAMTDEVALDQTGRVATNRVGEL